MTQTQTITDLQIPSGDDLYNTLMGRIEPDLTTDQLPLLDQKYKGESAEEAKVRAERYEKAFAEYDKQLAEYLAELQGKVREYQLSACRSVEHDDREKEERQLSALESTMDSL
jgi:hypothetical protein